MNRPGRIVVGIDGSEGGRVALRWAVREAVLHGAVLEVVHAWREPMIVVPDAYPVELVELRHMQQVAVDLIDRELASVGADPTLTIERSAVGGGTAGTLVEASRRADMVVVGRHGTGGFVQELVGPKVVQVAHHASCPVVVVPAAWDGQGQGVVVGLDESVHAQRALRWAATEASLRATPLTAVLAWGLLDQHHVKATPDFDPAYSSDDALAALDEIVAEGLASDATPRPVEVRKQVLNDLPASALLTAADEAELLVVGARGFGGFRDLLLGSVSHRCLVHATCPAVVVRGSGDVP